MLTIDFYIANDLQYYSGLFEAADMIRRYPRIFGSEGHQGADVRLLLPSRTRSCFNINPATSEGFEKVDTQ